LTRLIIYFPFLFIPFFPPLGEDIDREIVWKGRNIKSSSWYLR
jgi:hypothetical protein